MSKIQSTQIYDVNKATTLDTILEALSCISGTKSLELPDGTILKWGTLPAGAALTATEIATRTVVFPVQFPTGCETFFAIVTPATSTDFYGVTSLVAATATQAQFTIRNGATAQTTNGGFWFALGK